MNQSEYMCWQLTLINPRDYNLQNISGQAFIEVWQTYAQLSVEIRGATVQHSDDYYRVWLWWKDQSISPLDLGVIPVGSDGTGRTHLPLDVTNLGTTGLGLDQIEGIMISCHQQSDDFSGWIVLVAEINIDFAS